jgi:hypothetical protein
VGLRQLPRGPLVQDVEGADGGHLVTPQLDAHRIAGAHAEHVHQPTPHRELAHLLDEGHPLEAPLLESQGEGRQRGGVSHAHAETEESETAGDGSALLQGARRRDQDVGAAREERLHGLDPQSADLQVRLGFLVGEGLLLRIEAGGPGVAEERVQVRLQGGRLPWRRG